MNWVRNEKRYTEFSSLSIVIKHLSVSEFLQAATISARQRMYVFLKSEKVEKLGRTGWHRSEFNSVRDIFSELSSSILAKKAIAYTSSGLFISSFSTIKAEFMHRGFAVVPD